jgi:O-antigen/teichoic acid export membrane protein
LFKKLVDKLKSKDTGSVLIVGAGSSFLIKILAAALAFFTQVILARHMGVEQFGIFAYVTSWLVILVLLCKLGLDTSMVRFVAAYKATGEWGLLKGILKASNRLTITSSLIVSFAGIVFVQLIGSRISEDLKSTAFIGCLVLPFMALIQVRQALLRALRHVVKAILPEFIIQPATLLILVLISMIIYSKQHDYPLKLDANVIMVFDLAAFILTFIIITWWVKISIKRETRDVQEESRMNEWIAVTMPLLMMSWFNLINYRADVLMIGIMIDTTQAGIYSVSVKLANFLVWGLNAVNVIAAPLIAQLYSQKNKRELQRMVSISAAFISIYTIPAVVVMLVWGRQIISIFGDDFADAYNPLVLLAISQGVNALVGSVGYLLTMTGYQRDAATVIGIAAIFNIILNLILIPKYGIQGAAIASASSTILWNITMYILVRKRLGIEPSFIGLFKRR